VTEYEKVVQNSYERTHLELIPVLDRQPAGDRSHKSASISGMPQDERTYCLDADASDRGIGAVLSQEQDGQEV